MAEVLTQFQAPVIAPDGTAYTARACGGAMEDGRWQGWIEFVPPGSGEVLRTARETTQPGRQETLYWATGLEPVYLEGALARALAPRPQRSIPSPMPPAYDGPAPSVVVTPAPADAESVLDPFSVYQKGEKLLRRQLTAMSPWHIVNIIRAYGLSDESSSTLNQMSAAALIEIVVSAVKRQTAAH